MLDEAARVPEFTGQPSPVVLERRQRADPAEELDSSAPQHDRHVNPGDTRPAQHQQCAQHHERHEPGVQDEPSSTEPLQLSSVPLFGISDPPQPSPTIGSTSEWLVLIGSIPPGLVLYMGLSATFGGTACTPVTPRGPGVALYAMAMFASIQVTLITK